MVKRTEEQWHALFAEQAASNLSAAAFCKARKLCPKYFSLRRKQLLGETKPIKKVPLFIQAKPACEPDAGKRRRHPLYPGHAGPCKAGYDTDLHAGIH